MSKLKKVIVGVDLAKGGDMNAAVIYQGERIVLGAAAGGPAVIDREWINGFNAGRKADREALALALETIATAHGATVKRQERGPNRGYHGGSIGLQIALNGVGAMIDVNNIHGGAYALIHWHNDYSDGFKCRDFTSRFAAAVRAFSGRSPHKATTGGADWFALATALDAGLCMAARGEAFEISSAS